jgi:hypothetical protein
MVEEVDPGKGEVKLEVLDHAKYMQKAIERGDSEECWRFLMGDGRIDHRGESAGGWGITMRR